MYCHDLEAISSNPTGVKLGVCSTSFQVVFEPKISISLVCLRVQTFEIISGLKDNVPVHFFKREVTNGHAVTEGFSVT